MQGYRRQQSEEVRRHPDRMGIPQRRARLALVVDFGGTQVAQRQVVTSPQVRVHAQLTVDERGDRLGGQVLGRTELAGRSDWGVALRSEWRGQPRESATEYVARIRHG